VGQTLKLTLDHGAFPKSASHPSALAYLPSYFDGTQPLNVIVYIHGFYNCVTNVIGTKNTACTSGGPARVSYALAAQLEASKKNALLLLPEVAYDQANADPGNLDGGFQDFLTEALAKIGNYTIDQISTLVVASHSGGYKAAAGIAQRGGVYVSEVWLLDSLYGSTGDFDAWVQSDTDSFGGQARRFAIVYTATGGTLGNSQAMAARARDWVTSDILVDDRTTATWSNDKFEHGLLFKRTGLTHDGVPRYYFGRLTSTTANF
jgi:hypothetical protein